MASYSGDPFYPGQLRCEVCGQIVAALPPGCRPPPYAMAASLVGVLWPDLSAALADHEATCPGARPGLVHVRVAK